MISIRTRINSAVVGGTALVVAVAALIVGTTARAMILEQLDERLRSRARFFAVVWRPPPGFGESREAREAREARDAAAREARESREGREPAPEQPQWLYQTRDAESGEEISRASALAKEVSFADFGVKPGDPIQSIRLPDGRPFRLLAITSESFSRMWPRSRDGREGRESRESREGRDAATRDGATRDESPSTENAPAERPPDRRAAVTWIAVDASDVSSEVSRLVWILVAVWVGATSLAWLAAVMLSRTVLAPVASLSRTIAGLSPTNLSSRVPMEEVPLELSTVVTRLNALLEKLEAAFQRERATIGNMAHELRNPLSALRTTLEFGLYQGLSPQQRKTLESSLALAVRMQSLVNGLLTLTRIEAGQEVLARAEVDVVRILRDAWSTVEARAAERGFTASWRVPDELHLVTSPTHVELVAANLLDNAVSHGAAPGAIEIELAAAGSASGAATGGMVRLRVTNACAADPDGARPRENVGSRREGGDFFQPFWRSDPARSSARHSGLGLALCDRIVRLLGGTMDAQHHDARFVVTVTFPATAVPKKPAAVA
jgi:signal transduction histidine kinase